MATMEFSALIYFALSFAVYFPVSVLTYAWVADSRGVYDDYSRAMKNAVNPASPHGLLGAALYVFVVINFPFWDRMDAPWGYVVNTVALAAFTAVSALLRGYLVNATRVCQRSR